ncbi:MAG: Nif3-like dinuclear metal center hexameric protein [Propionibacteriaceae bacterium]|jgi:putative NIF3 family GTP cyclohydrolase 1 type 2|nr:Nif3-like dinuclear metal center hexameric protein [Propionibacteriaceae bacterium]
MSSAAQLVAQIKAATPVEIPEHTFDVFLEGDPDREVERIAVTMMATYEVLEATVAAGCQLLMTHEALYYNHKDEYRTLLAEINDPVFKAKRDYIRQHELVVCRWHDQWHQIVPDGINVGIAQAMGWELAEADPGVADISPITLGELLDQIEVKLGATSLRYAGDPKMSVARVGLDVGYRGFARNRELIARPDIDVAIIGEAWEWEVGEYAVDTVHLDSRAGKPKAVVVTGHVPSEQMGMEYFARWLADVVDVPVEFIATRDLYKSW